MYIDYGLYMSRAELQLHLCLSAVIRCTGWNNTQKCVCESFDNGGVGSMVETMMAPGYSSCNPVITECTTLHRASACADSRRVTMRATACESRVALKPRPAVQHPNHRYVPSLLYSRDYNICCCQKRQVHIAFPLPVSFFLSGCTQQQLWRPSMSCRVWCISA